MSVDNLPFNLDLLTPSADQLKTLHAVTEQGIFEGSGSKNFHSRGLFSVEIFGRSGTEARNKTFGYIKLPVGIIHPVIFKALSEMREFYLGLMSQTKYGIWDNKLKDFVPSNAIDGETGMHFFTSHMTELKLLPNESDKRSFNIKLFEKYKNRCMIENLLVLPAGLRDYEISESGKPEEGEVNAFYRKIIGLSNLINASTVKSDPAGVDSTRFNIQLTVNDLYNYFRSLIEGKSKFIQSKWASRKIFNSTRNVASTISNDALTADDPNILKSNDVAVGLHQYAKATMPLSLNKLRETYLNKIFPGPNSPAVLVNRKTLKKELVHIKPEHYDEWMGTEGLENIIARFGERDIRHTELMVDDHYLGLIYKGKDNTFKFLQDIDDIPDPSYKEYVYPITFTELLYISLYKDSDTIPAYITRYPIASYGSIFPAYSHLKTTMPSEVRWELNDDWSRSSNMAKNFPIKNADFFDTIAVHQSKLLRLNLDFDGDVISYTCVITDEAKAEVEEKLNSASYYVNANGKMYFGANTDTISYVLGYMTR